MSPGSRGFVRYHSLPVVDTSVAMWQLHFIADRSERTGNSGPQWYTGEDFLKVGFAQR